MSPPESTAPDRPFPGAHSQVPGAHDTPPDEPPPGSATPRLLPLEATRTIDGRGWLIRLPVRAEQVRVSKQVVVRERVSVRRQLVPGLARVQAEIRRERLRVDTSGDVRATDLEEEHDS